MFQEFFPHIGTKNYKYDEFDNKINTVSSGIDVNIDKYAGTADHDDLLARNE